ncbi:TRAP transporter large permease [Allosediminivita pacifica]|uniref:TRAP transporter large permease protein n=1 Tax=Allosediminivita pacifica TaxID=1267769 RepID=A0A2T6ATR5_9RHOB|nr:TRAP transporter large permease [Allosediminivita pacifica]PTX47209.1 tripartite ATP-independent transporter DctM subunit [Allosediminivita pacifica]GGB09406.1 membrane protein [Allosediminivita pacifica]
MIGTLLVILFGGLALALPVAAVLVLATVVLDQTFSFFPVMPVVGEMLWSGSSNFSLTAVPLFILTGELLLSSGIAARMFRAIDAWVRVVPGGMLHTIIGSSALFSATSGSSVATAATIGTVAMPEMKTGRYAPPLFFGSIAAGGTLGILIPPSINMIIYGVLAEVSIGRLYLAGMIPGLLLALLFSTIVVVLTLWQRRGSRMQVTPATWRERIEALPGVLPPVVLFMLMVGSIYVGVATPTEAAALGFLAALGMTAMAGRLSWPMLLRAFERTMRTTCMVMLIVLAAELLNFVMVSVGLADQIRSLVAATNASPLTIMLGIVVAYMVLGCFMETLSLMIATTPIVVPIITSIGYDPVWFGVVFMILIEAALITPPIGMNLFVVQSVRNEGSFADVSRGALPFVLAMLAMIGLLIAFPGLANWLPSVLRG